MIAEAFIVDPPIVRFPQSIKVKTAETCLWPCSHQTCPHCLLSFSLLLSHTHTRKHTHKHTYPSTHPSIH
ncbi:hypothetical protein GQ42DRAFT_22547 [Ramicandelaber brevisporus]|nr:hypothetical protein GQ42DRAFT_22547 [Ramicandelaber brevisporus]